MNEEEFFGVELQKAPCLISAPREHEPLTLASHLSASALPPLSFCTLVGNQEQPAPDPSPCWGLQQVSSHWLGLVHPGGVVASSTRWDNVPRGEVEILFHSTLHLFPQKLSLSLSFLTPSLPPSLPVCVCVWGGLPFFQSRDASPSEINSKGELCTQMDLLAQSQNCALCPSADKLFSTPCP